MTIKSAAVAASFVFTLSACAPPPTTVAINPEARGNFAGRTINVVAEQSPEMQRLQQGGGVVAVGGGLAGLAAALIVTAAMNAIETVRTDVRGFPQVDVDLAAQVQAAAAEELAGKIDATLVAEEALADEKGAFTANETGAKVTGEAARAAGISGLIFNVRNEEHSITSTGAGEDEAFIYGAVFSASLVDAETGELFGKAECKTGHGFGRFSDFKVNSLAHAGGDAVEARAKILAYETAQRQSRAAASTTDPHQVGENNVVVPDNPMANMTTEEQDKAFVTEKAEEAASACAGILVRKLLDGV